ncbi:MAG: GNAT family N-acetyltransferase [Acetobacteraceae bacterium]|nr:GNAT family N-acetyltransferase [Acetobacteraceae bacterium]
MSGRRASPRSDGGQRGPVARHSGLAPTDTPTDDTFQAIYQALDAHSRPKVGLAQRRLLVIPIRDDSGTVAGGLWSCTLFQWLHVEMLFVPQALRGVGVGSALMASAEQEARARGCLGAFVDTFSFQAPRFYERLGYSLFGTLDGFPPNHERLYFRKHFAPLQRQ